MKFLVVGDLHGQKPKIYFKDFDAIIAPGDFCSDEVTRYIFANLKKQKKNSDYNTEWWEEMGEKKASKMLDNALNDGRKILEFLNSFEKPVFLVPGNHDQTGEDGRDWERVKQNNWLKMKKGLKNLVDLHFRAEEWNGINFIGYGVVSGQEFPKYKDDKKRLGFFEFMRRKRDYWRKKKKLVKLFRKSKKPIIFIPHNVPYDTRLDKINNPYSPANGKHYGSIIARELVDRFQPLLCIGGHMHEHFNKQKLGKTTCINAGFGGKVNILIDLDEEKGKIKGIKFHPKTYG